MKKILVSLVCHLYKKPNQTKNLAHKNENCFSEGWITTVMQLCLLICLTKWFPKWMDLWKFYQ